MISPKRLLSTFLQLVRINGTAKKERPVANYLKRHLKSNRVREDNAGKNIGGDCGNLIVQVPGDARETVMLSAHMDTVQPTTGIASKITRGVIHTDGKTILGADDRAGIAMILELLAHLAESKIAHPPLELVFTIAEEIGLQGAKQMRFRDIKSGLGYILDSSLPVGMAVNQSVTIQRMNIRVEGRSAHAGVDAERGINAISIAAKALSKIPTGKIAKHTTLNVGAIHGGQAFNIVPNEVHVVLEIRSAYPAVLKKWAARVRSAFAASARQARGRVRIEQWTDFKTFYVSPKAPVAKSFVAGAKALGMAPVLRQYGGGSDGNVFNHMGIPCLVLGLGYHAPHTTEERMAVASLVQGTRLLASILEHCD